MGTINGYEINLLPQEDVIRLIMPILLAVKHLHDRKVIHKDVCPRNFRYSSEGVLKMIDLHEAKCQDFTHQNFQTQSQFGEVLYIAPEVKDRNSYNEKADMWSIGVILRELCTLKKPQSTWQGVLQKPLSNKYTPDMHAIVDNLLQVNPESRMPINKLLLQPLFSDFLDKQKNQVFIKTEFAHTTLHGEKIYDVYQKRQMFIRKMEIVNKDMQLDKTI